MTNAISKLHNALETWSFKYNCYEAVHPWTPFCTDSALEIGLTVFGQAIKIYTPLYLFSQLMRRKYDYNSFKATSQSILRSTTFISANAFFALFFFCSSQYLTGKFYYYAVAYLPGFLASSMAVMIERPNRRSTLAFYVANVASEALFRIYVGRGYLRAINHGQVYIFTLAIATTMMLAKKRGFEDDPLSAAIQLIVGGEEAGNKRRKRRANTMAQSNGDGIVDFSEDLAKIQQLAKRFDLSDLDGSNSDLSSEVKFEQELEINNNDNNEVLGLRYQELIDQESDGLRFASALNTKRAKSKLGDSVTGKLRRTYEWIKSFITSRHQLCPHENCSCLYYATRASVRALTIGYTAQLGIKLLIKTPLILKSPQLVKQIATDKSLISAGLFLSTFSGLYKATNCCLRWKLDRSTPSNCFIAGLIAGPALFIYPSPTVALYVLWKCLETLFNEAVEQEVIKNKDLFIVVLYGLATSQLFYSALMDPKYMKKSYMAFLDRISEHKLHMINRSVLDVFGTQASSGYEDYFPDLHPKFMSHAFLGSIWVWMIEHKIMANQLPTF